MAKTATDRQTKPPAERDLVAEFDAIRARIAERNPDMTEEDWDKLAEMWAEAVNERIRQRVVRMRQDHQS